MGCLCVYTSVKGKPMRVSAKECIDSNIVVNIDTKTANLSAKVITFGGNMVRAIVKLGRFFCRTKVKDNGINICTALVCSVGPRDYYYLLADDKYLITIDEEFIRVKGI